jgi:hypothetical protein
MASGLQRLGIKPEVIDRCLGHSAVVKGVAAVYLREQYMPERREAMQRWGRHIASVTMTPQAPGPVVNEFSIPAASPDGFTLAMGMSS